MQMPVVLAFKVRQLQEKESSAFHKVVPGPMAPQRAAQALKGIHQAELALGEHRILRQASGVLQPPITGFGGIQFRVLEAISKEQPAFGDPVKQGVANQVLASG